MFIRYYINNDIVVWRAAVTRLGGPGSLTSVCVVYLGKGIGETVSIGWFVLHEVQREEYCWVKLSTQENLIQVMSFTDLFLKDGQHTCEV